MITVKLLFSKSGIPIQNAIVMLEKTPFEDLIPDIASITDKEGEACIDCECRTGKYIFSVYLENSGIVKLSTQIDCKDSIGRITLLVDE